MDQSAKFIEAVKAGNLERVQQMLAQEPALANTRTPGGASAVLLAIYYGRQDIALALIHGGAQLDIFEACAAGRGERVAAILDKQPDQANAFASDGFTPLGLAAFFGHLDLVRLLIDYGAQVNLASRNAQRVMPLHSAVAAQHLAISQVLLERGANVNAAQENGYTPLIEAAQNGQAEMAQLLLRHGADTAPTTDDGKTALDTAREYGHAEVARLLERPGA